MRLSLVLALLVSLPCWTQTTATTGKADTRAPCSVANTGNGNKIQITCGIGKEQGQKMLAILNKILAKELDPAVVMKKLDEMHIAVQDLRQNPPDPNRGLLVPANDPNPFVDYWCEEHTPKDWFRLYLGKSQFVASQGLPVSGIRIRGKTVVGFKQLNEGISVSASVSSPDGKRVVFMRDNYFKLDNYFRKEEPDASTLNVFNETSDEPVFHLRYLNPKAILVTGTFSEQGITVIVDDKEVFVSPSKNHYSGGCSNPSVSGFEVH